MIRRLALLLAAVTAALVPIAQPASASGSGKRDRPDVIELPNGFFPEGIAIGKRDTFFTGSLVDGAIYRGDLRTGEGDVFVDGTPGQIAVGMDVDRWGTQLFVAGGPSGTARVYDTRTGELLSDIQLGQGFINDVIVTRRAAYFTNSAAPELYEVPLTRRGDVAGDPRVITVSGDFEFVPGAFNANGIEAVDRNTLIVVNSTVGELYAVDVHSGEASTIDTGGVAVNGDGLVLVGRTLYAVIGGLDQVTELRLSRDLEHARVTDTITSDVFDVPTTAARRGNSLYVVSAKFGTPPTPDTPYEIVRVRR